MARVLERERVDDDADQRGGQRRGGVAARRGRAESSQSRRDDGDGFAPGRRPRPAGERRIGAQTR